jgi:hypothetical protein
MAERRRANRDGERFVGVEKRGRRKRKGLILTRKERERERGEDERTENRGRAILLTEIGMESRAVARLVSFQETDRDKQEDKNRGGEYEQGRECNLVI